LRRCNIIKISEETKFSVETAFYLPIILAILSLPVFRVIAIKHIIMPDDSQIEQDEELVSYEEEIARPAWHHFNHHHRKNRKEWRKKFREQWRMHRIKWRKK